VRRPLHRSGASDVGRIPKHVWARAVDVIGADLYLAALDNTSDVNTREEIVMFSFYWENEIRRALSAKLIESKTEQDRLIADIYARIASVMLSSTGARLPRVSKAYKPLTPSARAKVDVKLGYKGPLDRLASEIAEDAIDRLWRQPYYAREVLASANVPAMAESIDDWDRMLRNQIDERDLPDPDSEDYEERMRGIWERLVVDIIKDRA